ncbi:MAG: nucleotidyl transferase AbiEii/AbiGii toxin family protein [Cytophagaceae bacterium]|nr:nucleotidyl transferase AbiEii/AbiGii toxin family protein [Cytophagaceae bacterium]
MLYFNTINDLLKEVLLKLMNAPEFNEFRLVGGTALSLQIGHRISVDIDLFSDSEYGSIDFGSIENYLKSNFEYFDSFSTAQSGFGKSYIVGKDRQNAIKLDVYYSDTFIQDAKVEGDIRLATVSEIVAMKIDVVQRGGRKKDFWDIHELFSNFSLTEMLDLHKRRYPYSHDKNLIIKNLVSFDSADFDFEPICLKGKYWQFIKEDIEEIVGRYLNEK